MDLQRFQTFRDRVLDEVCSVIVGKRQVAELVLTCFVCRGHVLLEDVPGTGKTALARALAQLMGLQFSRIQGTPDLLPSDVTGASVFRQKTGEFTFQPGPVFANVVLADEINRATPRAQSAMLECMEEKQVSSDGTTYALPAPFFVIATQNPVETQGTFPLPEAQLDRFMVKLRMGYPTLEEQSAILRRFMQDKPQERLAPVAAAADVLAAQQAVTCVRVQDDLLRYIGEICEKTRALEDALLGASPRAALALMRVSQSYAAVCGRDYVTPEDVKRMAVPVLAHRLILRTAFGQGGRGEAAVQEVLDAVRVPTEPDEE